MVGRRAVESQMLLSTQLGLLFELVGLWQVRRFVQLEV